MIIVMKNNSRIDEIEHVNRELENWELNPRKIISKHKTIVGLTGEATSLRPSVIKEINPWIESVLLLEHPFKRASLEYFGGEYSEVIVNTPNGIIPIGKNHPIAVVAGPCSVEDKTMIIKTAQQVKASGAKFLRGGAYKPRTSPYAFQGYGESALELLSIAKEETGLGIITEVMDASDLDKIKEVADVIQVGARNMQNFSLLKKVGSQDKPVLLKRGIAATINEWLMAAEYILAAGNPNVILCERGIRTFDTKYTRNTLDLSAIPVLRSLTHLPIMVDPSHGTGQADYVPSMAAAAVVAGTDSLMIEVHPNPEKALSDGIQSLTPVEFDNLMYKIMIIAQTVHKLK